MKTHWYVAHVYSGFEKKIAQQIIEQAAIKGLSHLVENVVVPSESVMVIKRGAKAMTESNFYPGYILIKMAMTDDTWHLVKDTPKVSGFLGGKLRPTPMSDAEAERVIAQTQAGTESRRLMPMYQIGESVRVNDGPFASFMGLIEEIDDEKGRLKVSVSIFGRSTPVDLEYTQVEKA